MHVVPFTHYLCTFYIIVGNVHATCIGDLSVDDYNLSVITVEHSMYPWEFHRFIFINLDAHIAYFFEVLLSEWLIVGSISKTIIECSYLDTFLDFLAKQIKKKSGNTIVSEVEVFRAFHPFDSKNTKLLLRMLKKGGILAAYKAKAEKISAEMESIKFLVPSYKKIKLEVPFLEDHERNLVVVEK